MKAPRCGAFLFAVRLVLKFVAHVPHVVCGLFVAGASVSLQGFIGQGEDALRFIAAPFEVFAKSDSH